MASSLKTPPELTDDVPYQDWKRDVEIWDLFSDLAVKKKGPALYLSLKGKARECVRDLKPDEIGAETGFKLILKKLDSVYEDNINLRTFTAFKTFYDFRRPADMGIKDFIIHYESLYHKLLSYDVKLPDGVQSFFVLTGHPVKDF